MVKFLATYIGGTALASCVLFVVRPPVNGVELAATVCLGFLWASSVLLAAERVI